MSYRFNFFPKYVLFLSEQRWLRRDLPSRNMNIPSLPQMACKEDEVFWAGG